MESRAKLLGHPIHQMLIVLPLGLFIGAVVFDGLYMWTGRQAFAEVGYWNIAGGIVGGLVAAVFGLIDLLAIPPRTRAKRIGLLHGTTNVIVVLAFASIWVLRTRSGSLETSSTLFASEGVALLLGAVGGWLGGELVTRLGVGVDDDVYLDAPSSLSGSAHDVPPSSTHPQPHRAG